MSGREFPETDLAAWGRGGTEGGPWASFFRRYALPLAAYARRRLGVDEALAEELVSRFVSRALAHERAGGAPLFRLYDPARGRFHSLLATSFWRFARDELAKEARRAGAPLDDERDALEARAAEDDFCRLVARELFAHVRADVLAACADEDERALLALKWPEEVHEDPPGDAEVVRRLGWTRARLRVLKRRIGERFVLSLRRQATRAGLSFEEAEPLIADACRVLDAERER